MSDTSQDLTVLEPRDLEKAREEAAKIDVRNSQAVLQFGVGAQQKIAGFADSVLAEIRNKDAGEAGNILASLLDRIKELDVDSLSRNKSFLERIPGVGSLVGSIRKFITRYEKVSGQIERIVLELETAQRNLLKDIVLLDELYTKNQEYLKDLDILLAAGKLKIEELRNTVLPELKAKAESTRDPADAQRFQDLSSLVDRFEKKLHDLKLSRMVSLQMAPQIRLIQNNNQVLVEKIQSSILTTLPLWKNQVVLAISLFRQKKALELQKEVSQATNELLKRNAALLKEGSLGVAEESERGIVELETLKQVNEDLITTLEETLRIQKEGREKRARAEQELVQLENQLKERLLAGSK
ncbi:MAG: toxic anion resistance protein [Spirochaetales bacterium]|nr:toxic anion resistance protein [Spirochaetales bacterium]